MTSGQISNHLVQHQPAHGASERTKAKSARWLRKFAEVYLRIALGAAFLSALADRFGLWGPPGKPGVAWGDFAHFTQYAAMVNSFLPAGVIPAVAWAATVAETTFALALILGIYKRVVTLGAAMLLLLFASAMTISFGIKAPLDYSVFGASAGAFLLFVIQEDQKDAE